MLVLQTAGPSPVPIPCATELERFRNGHIQRARQNSNLVSRDLESKHCDALVVRLSPSGLKRGRGRKPNTRHALSLTTVSQESTRDQPSQTIHAEEYENEDDDDDHDDEGDNDDCDDDGAHESADEVDSGSQSKSSTAAAKTTIKPILLPPVTTTHVKAVGMF